MSNEIGSYVVSIKAKIEGYQAEIEKIKKELSAVGKDTTIGKDVAAALAQVEKRVSALGKNTEIRISNDSQILRLRDNVIGVEQAFIDLGNVMQRVDSLQMDSELSNQYHNLVNQINALNQQMSASFEQAFSNARASSQSFADFMKSLKLNPSTMSLDEMNEKVEAYGSAAQQAYEKAQAAANEAATTVNELNSKLQITPHIDMAQLEQLDTLIRTTLDPTVEGNGRAYEQIINRENVEQVKRVLQSLIESSNKASEEVKKQWITTLDSIFSEKNFKNGNGFMTALNANLAPILRFINGRNASLVETANISEITTKADMARFLATTVPTDQTIQAVQDLLKNALAQLPDSLQGNLLERIIGIGANGQNVQAFRKEIDAIFGEIETRAKQLNTENAKLTQALVPATSKLNAANQKANEAAVNNNTAQANIETYRNIIQQHENEINTLRQEIEQLRTELAAITEKAANTPSSVQQSGKKLVEQHSTEGMAKAREEAQMYADQLEKIKGIQAGLNNLGNFIKRWFSIYAVARMVNQAFQAVKTTLKELDDTMTEIAIVTDMTQSDLWDQMGTYTDMARQYGSSIKGVYEVSQLYYQQGLQTADVMKMTEETLKMVRISGLDYTEATNYMTNAIRSFKMEMSDAQRVVDVYSALAASAATSTSELAQAMSKTASSAQAVDSSFESTAAMMTVMIEATREAPENIGSAMKSIISR